MNTVNLVNRLAATIEAASPDALELFSRALSSVASETPGEAQEMWRSLASEMLSLAYERRTGT